MKPLWILMFLLSCLQTQAQVSRVDSLLLKTHTYDSALLKPQQKADTIQSKIYTQKQKLDSVQSGFYAQSDSLKQLYKAKISKLDTTTAAIRHQMDSVSALQLPTEKYSHRLDSINTLREEAVASLNKNVTALKNKTTGRLQELNLPPELSTELSAATKNIDGFQLPVKDLNIPSLDSSDGLLKSLDGINTTVKNPVEGLGNMDGLKDLSGSMGDISKVTGELGGYQQDVQNITKGNIGEVKELPKALENKAGDLAGVSNLQEQGKGAFAPLEDMAGKVESPEAMKGEVLEQAQEVAIDHFAGKEEVLQQAMDKISKYKQRYASINSLSDITKKRPNEMRGKPFIERVLPGISFQILRRGDDLLIDFNPYVGYRLTGRITAGGGWNQRVAFTNPASYTRYQVSVFGPRVFGEYKLSKGVSPRLEIETLNTNYPQAGSGTQFDPQSRIWAWSCLAGIKKDYRFFKSIKGTAMIMINVYDPHHKSPYPDRLITRFGFEFPIKKHPKSS